MTQAIIAIMFVGLAASAYAQARRRGSWSWKLFAKTILAIVLLGGGVGLVSSLLGRYGGPEQALLITILAVVLIVAGVVGLAFWMRPKKDQDRD